jgi:Domain of unknown function (DUF4253)
VIADAPGLTEALHRTLLAGRRVVEAPGGCLRIIGLDRHDVLPAWHAARSVLPATGRRPVFRTNEFGGLHGRDPGPTPSGLADLDRAARATDPWANPGAWPDEPLDEDDLCLYVPTFEGADLLSEAESELREPTLWTVDRWVHDRVLADPALREQAEQRVAHLVGSASWYEPESVELWFLPTTEPHLAPAWIDFFGTLGHDERLAAALLQWHRAWGAELVAAWGTMLQLVAARRPSPGDEAWNLAHQHKCLASHQDADRWQLALALARSDEWFLHSRP